MSQHLDLEEQEQLEELKHFWKQYGNLISWILIAILGSYAGWNGHQYWQRGQATQSSAMFDELERAAQAGDTAKLDRALADMKDKFARTTYAQQAALLAAKTYQDKGNADAAKAALSWVAEKSSDPGYQAIAHLRLAALLAQDKAYEQALGQLAGTFPKEFAPLVADRLGDIYLLQGKKDQAKTQFEKAYQGFDEHTDYRRLVEVKLNALGGDAKVDASATSAASAPSSTEINK
ncbi:MAG: tetratricopeptide repeat protein [Betaproteobacteria bacterium]